MSRLLSFILLAGALLVSPFGSTTAEPTAISSIAKQSPQKNPLIDDVARNDPDGLRSLLQRLEILTTGQRDSGPARSGSAPTQAEAAQIDANAVLRSAYANDPAATLALLRTTNDALARAHSRDASQPTRRVALVIGNNGDSTWGKLGTARNDANLVATALTGQGFTLFQGHAAIDLDRRQLLQVIHDFSQSITPGTVALVYYAGHGVRLNGRNFLVPANAAMPRTDDEYDRNLVPVGDILLRQMQQANSSLNIIVLDACEDRAAMVRHGPNGTAAGFSPIIPHGSGTVVISSTGPNDVARDSVGNAPDSPFATAFASTLGEPGLEIRDVFDRVEAAVDRATDHQQQPWIAYSSIGRFYFSTVAASVSLPQSVAIDDAPFHCPAAGTTVTIDVARGAVVGTYGANNPADPALCRIVTSIGETKALLYNFYDAAFPLNETSIREGMKELLSEHRDQVEFFAGPSYVSRTAETWKRLGIDMLPINGRYVRTVKFERTSVQASAYNTQANADHWLVWFDPAAGLFVRSERLLPGGTPGLGTGGMPGVFKVISLAPG